MIYRLKGVRRKAEKLLKVYPNLDKEKDCVLYEERVYSFISFRKL